MSRFYAPWKRQKTYSFLTFSGGIEIWHWTKKFFSYMNKFVTQELRRLLFNVIIQPHFDYACSTCQWNEHQEFPGYLVVKIICFLVLLIILHYFIISSSIVTIINIIIFIIAVFFSILTFFCYFLLRLIFLLLSTTFNFCVTFYYIYFFCYFLHVISLLLSEGPQWK